VTIKVYNMDESCKSVQIDESTTVRELCSMVMKKNHLKEGPTWTIMEKLPELLIGRINNMYAYLLQVNTNYNKFDPKEIGDKNRCQ